MSPRRIYLLSGFLFLGLSFFCFIAAAQSFKTKPHLAQHTLKSSHLAQPEIHSQLTLLKLKEETAAQQPVETRISLETLPAEILKENIPPVVSQSGPIEGFLKINRKSSQWLITLGAAQGLKKGNQLDVYDNTQKIGEVVIENPLDVISYVSPSTPAESFAKDYYRVVLK